MSKSQQPVDGFGNNSALQGTAFPRHLQENTVEYQLFIIDPTLKPRKEELARLETIRKDSVKLSNTLLKDYIWQREEFKLEQKSEGALMYLAGLTDFGDSVDDEWLIVYLLRELSLKDKNLWIRVADTDGEFLLIEAAEVLPRWLNPEIAENRVWINNGQLHLIPLDATESRSVNLAEAHSIISNKPDSLIKSFTVEKEAFYRLQSYPEQITKSMHHALVTIPRTIAYLLHSLPAAIAPAVEAFYLRDPVALKPLQTASGLLFPPTDLVKISISFTRVLYAQLTSQQFSPPVTWKSIIADAEASLKSSQNAGNVTIRRLELGMKVTSGFEMLLSDSKNKDLPTVRRLQLLLDDLQDGVSLPSDSDMEAWKDNQRHDDEGWLDINFEEFEKELQGGKSRGPDMPQVPGFGDAKTEADLKKIVERFESFLSDDKAGPDGAELDDMDVDDDEDDGDADSEADEDIKFDQAEYLKMMRGLMGMPPDADSGDAEATKDPAEAGSDTADEDQEIRAMMSKMETELKEAGALNLDPPSKQAALKRSGDTGTGSVSREPDADDSDVDSDVDIDLNLAKNLLESFKSQAGLPGPGGNLIGLMGMGLPRDEDDADARHKKT